MSPMFSEGSRFRLPRVIIYCVSVFTCLIVLAACTKTGEGLRASAVRERGPVPDITVTSVENGNILKLSSLKGKVVLLNFWATWCPPCREEIPSMTKLQRFMSGKPFQLVAVSIDEGGRPAVDSFLKGSDFIQSAYLDPSGDATKLYGITGVPETFVIDKQGVLIKKIVGGLAWDSPEVISFLEGLMKQ